MKTEPKSAAYLRTSVSGPVRYCCVCGWAILRSERQVYDGQTRRAYHAACFQKREL